MLVTRKRRCDSPPKEGCDAGKQNDAGILQNDARRQNDTVVLQTDTRVQQDDAGVEESPAKKRSDTGKLNDAVTQQSDPGKCNDAGMPVSYCKPSSARKQREQRKHSRGSKSTGARKLSVTSVPSSTEVQRLIPVYNFAAAWIDTKRQSDSHAFNWADLPSFASMQKNAEEHFHHARSQNYAEVQTLQSYTSLHRDEGVPGSDAKVPSYADVQSFAPEWKVLVPMVNTEVQSYASEQNYVVVQNDATVQRNGEIPKSNAEVQSYTSIQGNEGVPKSGAEKQRYASEPNYAGVQSYAPEEWHRLVPRNSAILQSCATEHNYAQVQNYAPEQWDGLVQISNAEVQSYAQVQSYAPEQCEGLAQKSCPEVQSYASQENYAGVQCCVPKPWDGLVQSSSAEMQNYASEQNCEGVQSYAPEQWEGLTQNCCPEVQSYASQENYAGVQWCVPKPWVELVQKSSAEVVQIYASEQNYAEVQSHAPEQWEGLAHKSCPEVQSYANHENYAGVQCCVPKQWDGLVQSSSAEMQSYASEQNCEGVQCVTPVQKDEEMPRTNAEVQSYTSVPRDGEVQRSDAEVQSYASEQNYAKVQISAQEQTPTGLPICASVQKDAEVVHYDAGVKSYVRVQSDAGNAGVQNCAREQSNFGENSYAHGVPSYTEWRSSTEESGYADKHESYVVKHTYDVPTTSSQNDTKGSDSITCPTLMMNCLTISDFAPTNDDSDHTPADAAQLSEMIRSNLVTSKNDIEIMRADPNSPLFHVKSFKDLRLKPELLRGLYDMGFNAPSKIQETALPALLSDIPANMIAQSQSGTGKTVAFVVTMLTRVKPELRYPQCLCVAPTYELALQIGDVTRRMAQHMPNISIGFAIRGEIGRVKAGPIQDQIVIGTPGTVLDWCSKYKIIDLKKINVFVLDEADMMIDIQGHKDQSVRIQRNLRRDCQMLLFSATYNEEIMKFANTIIVNPIVLRLRRDEESLENIKQFYVECRDFNEKFVALSNLYGTITIGQAQIFCHTRRTSSLLAEQMTRLGHSVALLTGELSVEERSSVIARFRAGKEKILITTNVSARGLDVEQVTVVVNFDLPVNQHTGQVDCETYLHRIGRTGRFGKSGLAINMIDTPKAMKMMRDIERHFGRVIVKLDTGNLDELEKIGTTEF